MSQPEPPLDVSVAGLAPVRSAEPDRIESRAPTTPSATAAAAVPATATGHDHHARFLRPDTKLPALGTRYFLILCALYAIVLAVGVGLGWLIHAGVAGRAEARTIIVHDPARRDPLAPAAVFPWDEQPYPAFPIPPYAQHLKGVTIVLDPGHVGQSLVGKGADWKRGPTGLREQEPNLRVALALRDFLTAAGARVILTRTRDLPGTLPDAEDLADRARIANAASADLLVSIHHNAAGNEGANFTTIYYHDDGATSPASLDAARYLVQGIADGLRLDRSVPDPIRSDRSIYKSGGFGLLRHARVPAVLCESSFHTNREEEERLRDPIYNRREAYGMFLGIARWAQMGLPRVELVSPEDGSAVRGELLVFQLDDGLTRRDGKGPGATRLLEDSIRVELGGRRLSRETFDGPRGLLNVRIPMDAKPGNASLFVDFENLYGQHVLNPAIELRIRK